MMQELKEKLIKEHDEIDANEDKDTDLEGRHYRTDQDCLTAGNTLFIIVNKRVIL